MYHWWYPGWYNEPTYLGRSGSGGGRHPDRDTPEPYAGALPANPDRRLERIVATSLFDDAAVTGGHIDLSVQNGVVIVEGTVDSEAVRSAVVARAWSVAGVVDVCNALTVDRRRRRRR
jgi:hypothetical protein